MVGTSNKSVPDMAIAQKLSLITDWQGSPQCSTSQSLKHLETSYRSSSYGPIQIPTRGQLEIAQGVVSEKLAPQLLFSM